MEGKGISRLSLIKKVQKIDIPRTPIVRQNITFELFPSEIDFPHVKTDETSKRFKVSDQYSLKSLVISIIEDYYGGSYREDWHDKFFLGDPLATISPYKIVFLPMNTSRSGEIEKKNWYPVMCAVHMNNYLAAVGIIPELFPECALIVRKKLTSFVYFTADFESILKWTSTLPPSLPSDLGCLNANIPYNICRSMLIGIGSGGAVYELPGNKVIKIIDFCYGGQFLLTMEPDARDVETLALREALILYRIKDKQVPNVPHILDYGYMNGIYLYIIMTKLPARDESKKDFDQCTQVISDIATMADIIHRDIHPGNVILSRDNKCYLLDFGLAQVRSAFMPSTTKESEYAVKRLYEFEEAERMRNQPEVVD